MLFFPRLGCPSLVYVFVFQNLVVQVLVFVILPRLGCPSLVYVVFPRLGCPSFGLRFSFAKTWLSKFWFQLCQATWSERGKHRTAPNSMTHQHHSTNDDWQHLTPSFNIIYNTHQQQNQPQILNGPRCKKGACCFTG